MIKKTPVEKPPTKKTVKDQELWELHRSSFTPLKDKYRHTIFPADKMSTRPHHNIQESQITKYFDHNSLTIDSFRNGQIQNNGQHHRKQIRIKKVCVEARLDLHGLTRANALNILQKFISQAQLRGNQWILVITGKGDDKNPETLKKLLPNWLDQMPQVSGYATAKPKDGGGGSYYVKIKTTI